MSSKNVQYDDDYLDYDGDDGFADYAVTTIDGSPWILIATVVFCCSLYMFLPCVVALLNALDRKRKHKPITEAATNPETDVALQGAGLADSKLLHSGSVIDPSSSVSLEPPLLAYSPLRIVRSLLFARSDAHAVSTPLLPPRIRVRKTHRPVVSFVKSAKRSLPQQMHQRQMRELNL
jgi:hypothetical protein